MNSTQQQLRELGTCATATGIPPHSEPGCRWVALMQLGKRGITRLLVRSCGRDPCDLPEAALAKLWESVAPPDLGTRGEGVTVIS